VINQGKQYLLRHLTKLLGIVLIIYTHVPMPLMNYLDSLIPRAYLPVESLEWV